MGFQQSNFLWAFLLLLIPIIIHLFQFRKYKTISFPGVYRLKEQIQSSKKQKIIKNWWILASRLAAFLFFILAFFIPSCHKNTPIQNSGKMIVVIDCSPSMGLSNAQGILLEQAKQKARNWISKQPNENQFAVIGHHGFPIQEWLDHRQALERIDAISASNWPETLVDWSNEIVELKQSNEKIPVVVFSDAKADVFQNFKLADVQHFSWSIVTFNSSDVLNLSIDSAWNATPLSTNTAERIIHAWVSASDENFEGDVPVQLKSGSKVIGTSLAVFKKNKTVEVEFKIPQNSDNQIYLSLQDESIQMDNSLFLHFPGYQSKSIFYTDPTGSLEKLVELQPVFISKSQQQEAETIVQTNLDQITEQNWESFVQEADRGKNVVFVISSKDNQKLSILGIQGNWMKKDVRISPEALNNENFASAFTEKVSETTLMPTISQYFNMESSEGQNWQSVLTLENGSPILIKQDIGNGQIWVWLSDFSQGSSSFVKSTWFLPLFTQICMGKPLITKPICGFYHSNEPIYFNIPTEFNPEQQCFLENEGNQWVVQLSMGDFGLGIDPHFPSEKPGFYTLKQIKSSIGSQIISLNGLRTESGLSEIDGDQLGQIQKFGVTFVQGDTAGSLLKLEQPQNYSWRLFLWLSAFFFAVEWILLFFKYKGSKPKIINES